jgi:hypothetical protein
VNETVDLLERVGGERLIAWHHQNTRLNADEYVKAYRRVLLSGLRNTTLLYLDTNYWVRLRKAVLGDGSSEENRLLGALRSHVRTGRMLCVSQFHSMMEIAKQEASSLRVTARLLDELTEGVVISAPGDIVSWECAEYLHAKLSIDTRDALCPFAKVGHIHRNELPNHLIPAISSAGRQVVLKAGIDSFWNATFEDVFERFKWDTRDKLSGDLDHEVLAEVERRKWAQQPKGMSRNQVRLAEFSQAVNEQLRPVFTGLLRTWHIRNSFPEGLAAPLNQLETIMRMAVSEFRDKTLGRHLPCMSLPVELYTLYETTFASTRPIESNDWMDWRHAAAAMPYCDLFLTERHLAHQLRQELKAQSQYECEVYGSVAAALARLEAD